jgi:hypothetical protein
MAGQRFGSRRDLGPGLLEVALGLLQPDLKVLFQRWCCM